MQIVYYFAAALRLGAPDRQVSFSVPTGNFGDIYAGYLAKQMGLPVDQLVVATNQNDILHRFISNNDYSKTQLSKTYSPSMDILVSSNFERYLFDLFGRDSAQLTDFMLRSSKERLSVSESQWQAVQAIFDSASVSDETTCRVISETAAELDKLLDPHSNRRGIRAFDPEKPAGAHDYPGDSASRKIQRSHYSCRAGSAGLPAHLADLFEREERYSVIANDLGEVSAFISAAVGQQV